jgi:hypothetical protein
MRLNEIEEREDIEQFEAFWAKTEAQCSEAVNAVKATRKFLWHGASEEASPTNKMIILPPRKSREPMNMPAPVQEMIDSWFKDNGFAARRNNSTFLITNKQVAKYYTEENLYICFPANGFDLTWSPKVVDLYGDLDELYDYWQPVTDSGNPTHRALYMKRLQSYIKGFMDKSDWQKGNLPGAMAANSELMVANKPIYCFRDFYSDSIKEKLGFIREPKF